MKTENIQNLGLFPESRQNEKDRARGKTTEKLQRLDLHGTLKEKIRPLCRLRYGEIWTDPVKGHKVGVLDATRTEDVKKIVENEKAELIINDPPYNVAVGNANTDNLFKIRLQEYMDFSEKWIRNTIEIMSTDSHLYIWIGADYRDGFQPLPDLMILMRKFRELQPKNFITLRNQRGYGTQKNWMWVRQELLHYVKGHPDFRVVYTDIPKILRGYYKVVNGKLTENVERSKSNTIRPGNVWVDIQQVFYRLEENVPGCYAQKPLKAIERLISTSSKEGSLVVDFFAHSGTTLVAAEKLGRKAFTFDIDPIFAEITIRRLELYRKKGQTGWQWESPFPETEGKTEKTKWT